MNLIKPKMLLKLLSLFVVLGLNGCGGSKVIFVPESDGLVRLGSDVKGHVYYYDGTEWVESKEKVHLPAGWYAGSLNVEDEETSN